MRLASHSIQPLPPNILSLTSSNKPCTYVKFSLKMWPKDTNKINDNLLTGFFYSCTGLIVVIMRRCCDRKPVSGKISSIQCKKMWKSFPDNCCWPQDLQCQNELFNLKFMSNKFTCATLFWVESPTHKLHLSLNFRRGIKTSNETLSYAFIANSLYPLKIIFQLIKKYHWELNITK